MIRYSFNWWSLSIHFLGLGSCGRKFFATLVFVAALVFDKLLWRRKVFLVWRLIYGLRGGSICIIIHRSKKFSCIMVGQFSSTLIFSIIFENYWNFFFPIIFLSITNSMICSIVHPDSWTFYMVCSPIIFLWSHFQSSCGPEQTKLRSLNLQWGALWPNPWHL